MVETRLCWPREAVQASGTLGKYVVEESLPVKIR
jgi:hypothetical protein